MKEPPEEEKEESEEEKEEAAAAGLGALSDKKILLDKKYNNRIIKKLNLYKD